MGQKKQRIETPHAFEDRIYELYFKVISLIPKEKECYFSWKEKNIKTNGTNKQIYKKNKTRESELQLQHIEMIIKDIIHRATFTFLSSFENWSFYNPKIGVIIMSLQRFSQS